MALTSNTRLLKVVEQLHKVLIFASNILTIVSVLLHNAFMYIFYNCCSLVFGRSVCNRIKLRLTDAAFEMFSCLRFMN